MFTDYVHPEYAADGISFIDLVGNKRYYPLKASDGTCLCTDTGQTRLEPGKPTEIYARLPAPPPEMKRIGLAIPSTAVFPSIPIAEGPAPQVPGATPNPSQVQLAQPRILPLVSTVEGDNKAVDDRGGDEDVRLSSDVLFALNKANINARAKALLTEVAKRIDESPGKVVKVDGHTDNTGNDAINEPLSQRRAQAVQRELEGMVTRQGVTYQSAGHGSRQPIADNETAQGRQRNRRVTVSFAKPAPPKPSAPPVSAPPPSPGSAQQVIATAQPKDSDVQGIKAEITSFKRDPSGLVTVLWRITNTTAERFATAAKFRQTNTDVFYFESYGTHGVTLHDEANALRYYTLRDQDKSCVCTHLISDSKIFLYQNETSSYFNVFKLPPELKSADIEIPGYQPVKNVQIS
jgi:outer membrane protein OmpA-like peptidoglycan-associated protein